MDADSSFQENFLPIITSMVEAHFKGKPSWFISAKKKAVHMVGPWERWIPYEGF
jgi:hypothetical protein